MSTGTTCQECGMNCQLGEHHPFVACLIYKGCHDATVTRENIKHITQQWRDIGYREAENHIPSTGKMVGLTRITEQDAREILNGSLVYDIRLGRKATFSEFLASAEGRALLDRLNAGRADHIAEAGKMINTAMIPMLNGKPKITNEMKSECIGEFSWQEDWPQYNEKGDLIDGELTHEVPWNVCKEIYKRMATVAIIADHSVDANKMNTNTIDRRALEWMLSNDTGLSSEAICAHMLGLETEYARHPSDPADLGRCLRLLELIPEWKPRIKEMANYGPGWAGQIEVWDELNNTMANEVGIDWSKGKKAPETYKAMKLAQASGYRNDPAYECGFDKNGFVSWSTKNRDEAVE